MSVKAGFIVPHPPLIIPEIGRGEERKIQKTIDSYDRIAREISQIKPDTIIITTPHSIAYSDYFHISPGDKAKGDFRTFGQGKVSMEVEYDKDLALYISKEAEKYGIDAGGMGARERHLDHGSTVPLYFVNKYYTDYKLVRISISGLSLEKHYEFGKVIGQVIDEMGKKVVFIASGDLSHRLKEDGPYGFREEGPIFDRQVTEAMASGDMSKLLEFDASFLDAAGECGLRSFLIMAGALGGKKIRPSLLSYEGPFGVGYAVASFHLEESNEYLDLARKALENYILNKEVMEKPKHLSKKLLEGKAGAFVSLHKDGELRGCIGTIIPTRESLAEEIIHNAISAGTADPRFSPVTKDELPRLVYSVDIMGEIEEVDSIEELDPKRYGVIVSKGFRRGLLLPNLEGIDTAEKQVYIALQKAGISPREKYKLERFEVVRHQ